MLKEAICSKDKHEELLEKANAGVYWDKFGSILGLFAVENKKSSNDEEGLIWRLPL